MVRLKFKSWLCECLKYRCPLTRSVLSCHFKPTTSVLHLTITTKVIHALTSQQKPLMHPTHDHAIQLHCSFIVICIFSRYIYLRHDHESPKGVHCHVETHNKHDATHNRNQAHARDAQQELCLAAQVIDRSTPEITSDVGCDFFL